MSKRAIPRNVDVSHSWVDGRGKKHEHVFSFHFYVNEHGRYVALGNTVGFHDLHGEGHTWWAALSDCMSKYMRKPPRRKMK